MSYRFYATLAGLLFSAAALAGSLTANSDRMDQVARYYVDNQQFMGSVLVARGDEVLFSKAYGSANLEWNVPNTVSTKFRIGSVTKQFTAAAILLLDERGKLKLDDPVKMYYPDAPATWEKITLQHLLGHTSGIPNYTAIPDFERMSAWRATPEELVKRVQDSPLESQPGAEMRYSNTGYVLLGMVIEKASGSSYATFLKENIFEPLGMKDSGYDENALILPQRAAGYSPRSGGVANATYVDMTTPFAAGALYSTVEDLLRWERALFGKKLLSEASLQKMTTKGKGNYGLGVGVAEESGRSLIQHGGGIPGFNAKLAYYPKSNVAVVALSNLNGPGAEIIVAKLGSLAHGDAVVLPPERRSISLSAKVLETYVGSYEIEPGRTMTVTLENGRLHCQVTGDGKFPIEPESATRFFPVPFEAQFEFRKNARGNVTGMVLRHGNEETFAKRTVSAPKPAGLEKVHIDVGSSDAPLVVTAHVEDYRVAPLDVLAPATAGDSAMTRFMKRYNEVARAGDIKTFVSLFAPDVGADEDSHHTPQSLREQFADLRSVRLLAVLHWGELQVGFVQYEAADGEGGTRRWTASHPARCVGSSCQITGHFENGLLGQIVTTAFAGKGGAQIAASIRGESLPILPAVADAAKKAVATNPIVLHLNRASEATAQAAKTIVATSTDKQGATVDAVYSLGPDVCVALLRSNKDRTLHWLPLQRAGEGWAIVADPSNLDAWTVLSSTHTYQALQNR
jgi:CubicO group peptidase (beta-lactamase class C family)